MLIIHTKIYCANYELFINNCIFINQVIELKWLMGSTKWRIVQENQVWFLGITILRQT